MLKRIRLKDFKSFVDEEVEVAPLTLLVGTNASGKSNFLDAMRFLKGIAFDLSLGDVLNGETKSRPDAWPGIRGRAEETARYGTEGFTLDSSWSIRESAGSAVTEAGPKGAHRLDVQHSITCRVSPSLRLENERLSVAGSEVRISRQPDTTFRNGGARSVIGDYDLRRSLEIAGRDAVQGLGDVLRASQFPNINPAEMRGFGLRDAPLGPEGKNVSGVLATICEDEKAKRSLVTWLNELSASEIENLEFREFLDLGDVMAVFIERGGKRISVRSISDGTLHFLGTLLTLRTAEPGSLILIEEIEAGLHPSRIRLLVEYLEAVIRELEVQIIATTHSPVLLQWLSDDALRNAIVFGRVPDREGTVMRRLGDLPYFNEVVQREGIDEMLTIGWLEMAL
jgi:AAA domain, putative AbiEii toxin, Type IV TA system/AAA ATPase domain